MRAYTTSILRELGYTVVEAADGAAALGRLATGTPVDLLFTDIGLPGGLNGRDLADEARRQRPGLKVLFTSGYAQDGVIQGSRPGAETAFLQKPFTFAALADKLRAILASSA